MIAATPAHHQAQQNQAHPPAAYVGGGPSIHHPAGMPPHQQQGPPHGGPVRPWHQNGDPGTSMVRPRPAHALLAVSRAVSDAPDARMEWDQGLGGLGGRGGPSGPGGICVSRCMLARFSRICARSSCAPPTDTAATHTHTHTRIHTYTHTHTQCVCFFVCCAHLYDGLEQPPSSPRAVPHSPPEEKFKEIALRKRVGGEMGEMGRGVGKRERTIPVEGHPKCEQLH